MIAANDAHIIIERVEFKVRRTRSGANSEAAAGTVHSDCWNIRSWEVGIDSEVTHTAIALAEIRSGFATDEMVVRGAKGVNDIGSEQICASDRQSFI